MAVLWGIDICGKLLWPPSTEKTQPESCRAAAAACQAHSSITRKVRRYASCFLTFLPARITVHGHCEVVLGDDLIKCTVWSVLCDDGYRGRRSWRSGGWTEFRGGRQKVRNLWAFPLFRSFTQRWLELLHLHSKYDVTIVTVWSIFRNRAGKSVDLIGQTSSKMCMW